MLYGFTERKILKFVFYGLYRCLNKQFFSGTTRREEHQECVLKIYDFINSRLPHKSNNHQILNYNFVCFLSVCLLGLSVSGDKSFPMSHHLRVRLIFPPFISCKNAMIFNPRHLFVFHELFMLISDFSLFKTSRDLCTWMLTLRLLFVLAAASHETHLLSRTDLWAKNNTF